MKNTLLFTVAVAGALTMAAGARAGDAAMSPKGQALADSLRKAPGMAANDVNLATNRPVGNAKAASPTDTVNSTGNTGSNINLAHAPRPTLSPKDPRYESVLRENAEKNFQVAPLK